MPRKYQILILYEDQSQTTFGFKTKYDAINAFERYCKYEYSENVYIYLIFNSTLIDLFKYKKKDI